MLEVEIPEGYKFTDHLVPEDEREPEVRLLDLPNIYPRFGENGFMLSSPDDVSLKFVMRNVLKEWGKEKWSLHELAEFVKTLGLELYTAPHLRLDPISEYERFGFKMRFINQDIADVVVKCEITHRDIVH